MIGPFSNFASNQFGPSPAVTRQRFIPRFNPDDPQYLCFCKTLRAIRGAYAVGFLHILSAVAIFIYGCLADIPGIMAVTIPVGFTVALFSSLLLFGLRAQMYKFLIPYLAVNIALVLGAGILLFLATFWYISQSNGIQHHIGEAVLLTLVALSALFSEVWFFMGVLAALRFVRDKEAAKRFARINATHVLYAGQDFSAELELQRISVEYSLPTPPPTYNESQTSFNECQNGASFAPPCSADGPPGYDEAWSSEPPYNIDTPVQDNSSSPPQHRNSDARLEILLGVENLDFTQQAREENCDNSARQDRITGAAEIVERYTNENSVITDFPVLNV